MSGCRVIYVVMGTTGEYSDRSEWPVCAFFSEDVAKERVLNASKRAKEIEAELGGAWYGKEHSGNELDPDMQMDYTGTTYFYYTVPLVEEDE